MAYIYQIRSQINGSSYIGGSLHYRERKIIHKSLLRNDKHPNRLLQQHVNIYGLDDLQWMILEKCKDVDIIKREQYYTDFLNNDFNIRKTVHANLGLKHTPETRIKISKASKNISTETRKKLSKAAKLRKHSSESIEKRRLKVLGMKMTDEQKRKLSNAKRKKVYQYDKRLNFIKEWPGAIDAANELNLNNGCISLCCKGKIKYTGNYIFRFHSIKETARPLL